MVTKVLEEAVKVPIYEGSRPEVPFLQWVDRFANLAILPCLLVAFAGVCFHSLSLVWAGTVAMGVCAIAKVVAFVPIWKAKGIPKSVS